VDRSVTWRVSSFSGQASCVQVRNDLGAMRDSKDPGGPTLRTAGLRELVRSLKAAASAG
jgi:hypothetical protein